MHENVTAQPDPRNSPAPITDQLSENGRFALSLRQQGRIPIPLCWPTEAGECGCGRGHTGHDIGKAPLLGDGYQNARPTQYDVADYWTRWPLANVGILLAPSGLLFVGPDTEAARQWAASHGLPPTMARISSNSGYLYLCPDGCPQTTRKIVDRAKDFEMDVKANGYAVVFGRHQKGNEIFLEGDFITPAPEWAVRILVEKAKKDAQPVALPKDVPAVDLDTLNLSPWIKRVIREGRNADPTRYPSRSEAQWAVLKEMAELGYDAMTIAGVMLDPANRVGEKAREKGRVWLGHEIGRARGGTVAPEQPPIPDERPEPTPAPQAAEPPQLAVLMADYPQLPEGVLLDPEEGAAGRWLDLYMGYAEAVSPMTPRLFHEFSALFLVAVAIARRLYVGMPFDRVYPNLFGAVIAPTTLFRKTTGMNVSRRLARRAFPHLLAPQDTTPEAFLANLAGYQPSRFDDLPPDIQDKWRHGRDFAAQRGLDLDEMSGLMASAGRDYNAGLLEAFMVMFDCTPEYTRLTQSKGMVVVRHASLSFMGASTPRAMATFLADERLWGMGWWPRFALLTPEVDRPEWKVSRDTAEPVELVEGLQRLCYRLPRPSWPDPPEALAVLMDDGVFGAWERYNKATSYDMLTPDLDERLFGTYGRLPTQLLKVATLLAAMDWPETEQLPRITRGHLARAMAIVESWRISAHRALDMGTQNAYADMRRRILRLISQNEPEGITKRDICRGMRDKRPDEVEDALAQLATAGDIEMTEVRPEGRGRPTDKYKIAR